MPSLSLQRHICLQCRLRLQARLYRAPNGSSLATKRTGSTYSQRNLVVSTTTYPTLTKPLRSFTHLRAYTSSPSRHTPGNPISRNNGAATDSNAGIENRVAGMTAIEARQQYGDRLPEGVLGDKETLVYERLYGLPLPLHEEREADLGGAAVEEIGLDGGREGGVLLKESGNGELEEVMVEDGELDEELVAESAADEQLRRDMETTLTEEVDEEAILEDEHTRTHPLTLGGRFSSFPAAIQLPKASLTEPIGAMLAEKSNRHLDEGANKTFGGFKLPYGTTTPRRNGPIPQKPIPLTASQSKMTDMEADLYMAVLMGGNYAVARCILSEVRRRLGSTWIESFLAADSGPRILDTGSAGASVLAWHDVLRAEWALINDNGSAMTSPPPPLGKATVVTGSDALRHRAAQLVENTTFLPRLPDMIHARLTPDAPRKLYDIIIAPHALWHQPEEYMRHQYLQNLWSLLSPDGGVLVLWEKGLPRGFEVVADARQYLLDRLFAHQASSPADASSQSLAQSDTIIAPCTTHAPCPMYTTPGATPGRHDTCHFAQRYHRPSYLSRLVGKKDSNIHEDAPFSYVAVQKGRRARQPALLLQQDEAATARAFDGIPLPDEPPSRSPTPASPPPSDTQSFYAHLPRQIQPPIKRKGHIILDVCTPAGALERWTVPRSYSKQAYHDARKSRWGDLWALGAKTRVRRGRLRLGAAGAGAVAARQASSDLEDVELGDDADADADADDGLARRWVKVKKVKGAGALAARPGKNLRRAARIEKKTMERRARRKADAMARV